MGTRDPGPGTRDPEGRPVDGLDFHPPGGAGQLLRSTGVIGATGFSCPYRDSGSGPRKLPVRGDGLRREAGVAADRWRPDRDGPFWARRLALPLGTAVAALGDHDPA